MRHQNSLLTYVFVSRLSFSLLVPRFSPDDLITEDDYFSKNDLTRIPSNRKTQGPDDLPDFGKGEHGYDNDVADMRPVFMAQGPDFKSNYSFTEVFPLTNIYPLMCRLLRIHPSPSNGSYLQVSHLLRHEIEIQLVRSGAESSSLYARSSLSSHGSQLTIIIINIIIMFSRQDLD